MALLSGNKCVLLLLMLIIPQWIYAAEDDVVTSDVADTRVLIDVSGSMKENDPANLRRPALRLLVGLLPKDSRAAVWTFAQFVNQQIPLGKVDEGWRERARESAGKIHSRGLYTDIEQVLKRSTEDWKKVDGKYTRHLVLLTDGMVDISKNSLKNAASRRRIIAKILPQLKKIGVKVHTIALSKRADHRLLKRLSGDTDGWYEQVDDADRLKRIFLRIFEKVAKPDTVPLKDNKFQIDSSVKEATLLVFRSEGTDPTKVLMPDGSSFSSEDPPKGVSWHRDDGYDLLTIANPKAGVWQIQAEVDPDNRVMVVTDLKMVSNTLPNRLLQGEQKPLKIQFTDRGKKIVNKEFLDVVNMRAEYAGSGSPSEPRPMFDDGKDGDKTAADGEFTHVMSKTIGKGKIELIVTAEGKTFVRERRYTFESIPAVTMERLDGERRGKAGLMATILPEPNLVDGQSIQVEASLIPKEGEPVAVMFLPGIDGMSQETWIDRSALKGEWNLDVHVKAKSVSGVQLELDLDSVLIKGLEPAPEPVAVSEPAKPEPKPEPAVEAEPAIEVDPDVEAKPDVEPAPDPVEAKPDTVPLPDEAEDEGGVSSVLWFVLLNLLVVLAGGGAYWYFRKRGAAIYSGLIDDEEEGGADREVVSDNSYAKDIEVEDEDEDEETAECLELTDDDEVGGDADKTVVIGNSEVVAEEAMENSEAEGVVGDEEVTKRDQGEEIIGEGGVEESQSDNS